MSDLSRLVDEVVDKLTRHIDPGLMSQEEALRYVQSFSEYIDSECEIIMDALKDDLRRAQKADDATHQ